MSSKRDVRDARFGEREPKDAAKPAPPPRPRGEAPFARTSTSRSTRGPQELPPEPDDVPSPLPAWANANLLVPTLLAFALGYALSMKYGTHWKMPWEHTVATVPADAGEYLGEPADASAAAAAAAAPAAPTAPPMPLVDAGVALDPNPAVARVRTPTSPDPRGGHFTLAQATEGMTGDGPLHADIVTSMGAFDCELLPDDAPINVANFVGLARGRREFWDPVAGAWARRAFYNGSIFHRVIPDFMIQGGDQLRSGTGDTGYELPDENVAHHDAAGLLCMANHGPNTGSAQFFITEVPKEHLDGSYSVFGRCTPTDLVRRIAAVPRGENDRPNQPVYILRVDVRRGAAR